MSKTDNKLSGARNLGVLGTSTLRQADQFKPNDPESLYRFKLDQKSRFDLTLSGLARKMNADVELYRFKRPADEVVNLIGNLDFRFVSGSDRDANLQLVTESKQKSNRNENLSLNSLEAGDYVIRVTGQKGKSRYSLQVATSFLGVNPNQTDKIAPSATLDAVNFVTPGSKTYSFNVTYNDNTAVNVNSLDDNDILVIGPNGFSQLAKKVTVIEDASSSSSVVTYQVTAPTGNWSPGDNGNYSTILQANQVNDINNNFASIATLGSFLIEEPVQDIDMSGITFTPAGSDFVLNIDPVTRTVKNFSFTVRNTLPSSGSLGSVKLPQRFALDSAQFQVVKQYTDIPSNIDYKPGLNKGDPIENFRFLGKPQAVFFADFSRNFPNPVESRSVDDYRSGTLIIGVQTSNSDFSDPLSLLIKALDGETPGTRISGSVYSFSFGSFFATNP